MAFESLKDKMKARPNGAAAPAAAPSAPAAPTTPPKPAASNPMAKIRAANAAKAAAAAAAPPAAESEEIVLEPEVEAPAAVERPAATTRAVAGPSPTVGGGLTLFNAEAASNALMAWVDRDENRAAAFAGPEFPTVALAGGNAGGMLDALQGTPGEIAGMLPAGRQPFQCIFIGYRMQVLLWPSGYDPNDKTQPSYSAFIGPDAADDQAMLQAAAVKYMFTKKDDKAKFDETGHPRPQLEVLVYLPTLDHLAVLRTVAHQESLSNTLRSLAKCLPDGKLQPTPVLVTPVTNERSSKGQTWKMHHLEFSLAIDANAKKNYAAFQTFANGAKEDAEFMELFAGWAKTTMTDEIRERLQAAASL